MMMNSLALPLLVMLALVLVELYITHVRRARAIPWRDVVLNLNSGHVLMWLLRGVEIAVFAWVLAHFSLHWVDHWPPLAQWAFAVAAWDLGFYWMHRIHHEVPALWAVHLVHHEGEHYNLSLGIRNAWISSLTTLPFTSIPLALAGVPLEVFIVVSTLHYTVQFYNHNGIIGRSGWLERVLITPAHHRVHHGQNREYCDHNYGGTFLLWDKLFGTFQPELPEVPVRYGVTQPTASTNPFWANVAPVLRYVGWRVPNLSYRERDGEQTMGSVLIGVGGLLLFCVVIYYIHRDGSWAPWGQTVFFTLIFCATLALGGMSDGRPWGLPCWIVIGFAMLGAMFWSFDLRDPLGLIALGALPLHGMVCLSVPLSQI
jgi:sterol desaturase/sphingolipid hydroxylase (fatty acid hydroxylase superfamily)